MYLNEYLIVEIEITCRERDSGALLKCCWCSLYATGLWRGCDGAGTVQVGWWCCFSDQTLVHQNLYGLILSPMVPSFCFWKWMYQQGAGKESISRWTWLSFHFASQLWSIQSNPELQNLWSWDQRRLGVLRGITGDRGRELLKGRRGGEARGALAGWLARR